MGDFNDYSAIQKDVQDNVPMSDTVHIIREALSPYLVEVSARITMADRYTYGWGRYASQIDHILVSKQLDAYVTAAVIDHTDASGKKDENSDAWKDNRGSDHWPFKVTLVFPNEPSKAPLAAGSPTQAPALSSPTVSPSASPRNVHGGSCPSAPGAAGDRRAAARQGRTVVLATYNMYWLFDGVGDPMQQ